MTQSAVVTRIIDSETAEITVIRSTACSGNCGSCGGTCSYKNRLTARAVNNISAKVGDRVVVSSKTSRVISAALLVYILPLVTFFAGYALAYSAALSEGVSVAISLAAFLLGVLFVVVYNRTLGKNRSISFEIIALE